MPSSPPVQISPDGPTIPVTPAAVTPAAVTPVAAPGDEATLPIGNPANAATQPSAPATAPPPPASAVPGLAVPGSAVPGSAVPGLPGPADTRVEAPAAKPEKWAGRVVVPGAAGPGQKKAAAPIAPTQKMARVAAPTPTVIAARVAPAPRPQAPRPAAARVRRRSGFRRFLGAVLALLLLLAVPVVSAYVAYKLALGDSPFDWPPAVDLSRVF